MMSLQVTVVPVALRPFGDDAQPPLRVCMLRRGGDWLTDTVADPTLALMTAKRLLEEAVHPELKGSVRLENVGVDYSSEGPNLLFTTALPIAAAELSSAPDDWPLLTPWGDEDRREAVQMLRPDPVRVAMIAYWRGQLMHRTAAFDFLPRYFSTSQVRSVYASVWGENQAEGNFQRWLGSARDEGGRAVCEDVQDALVRREAQSMFVKRMRNVGLTAAAVTRAWDPKIVGMSASVAALAGVVAIPAAVIAGSMVGSLISWQNAKGPGRPPSWYRRTVDDRVDLKAGYPVRPAGVRRPPTFVG